MEKGYNRCDGTLPLVTNVQLVLHDGIHAIDGTRREHGKTVRSIKTESENIRLGKKKERRPFHFNL